MAHQTLQDVYGFYCGETTHSIEEYPIRLPRTIDPTEAGLYEHTEIDALHEIRLLELLPPSLHVVRTATTCSSVEYAHAFCRVKIDSKPRRIHVGRQSVICQLPSFETVLQVLSSKEHCLQRRSL